MPKQRHDQGRRRWQAGLLAVCLLAMAGCRPDAPSEWPGRDAMLSRLGMATATPEYKSCYESIAQTKQACGENAGAAIEERGAAVAVAAEGTAGGGKVWLDEMWPRVWGWFRRFVTGVR